MQLYPYQIEGVKTLLRKKRFLLRDEPGLGKTAQLVTAVTACCPRNVLVICPKSMVLTWEREIETWGSIANGYTVINHDRLITKEGQKLIRQWDIVIADESHMYLKNINTKRAKMFFSVIEKAERVWLATATVASKSGEDYYCTLKILLPDLMSVWGKDKFIKRYCKAVEHEFYSKKAVRGCKSVKMKDGQYRVTAIKYEGFQHMDELKKIFAVCSLKRTEEEVKLQLPELTETDMYISSKVKKYEPRDIHDICEFISEGYELPMKYQEEFRVNGLNKIDSVVELLQTYPPEKKVVIFAWHREVIQKLSVAVAEDCKRSNGIISGEITKVEDRQRMIDNFQEGNLSTLIVNIQSGGAGITLTAATVGIYVQFSHSVIHWVQSRKRIHRIGSKKPVQIIKLIAKGSIDEDIFAVLKERAKFIKEIEG